MWQARNGLVWRVMVRYVQVMYGAVRCGRHGVESYGKVRLCRARQRFIMLHWPICASNSVVEYQTFNLRVMGSSPIWRTTCINCSIGRALIGFSICRFDSGLMHKPHGHSMVTHGIFAVGDGGVAHCDCAIQKNVQPHFDAAEA